MNGTGMRLNASEPMQKVAKECSAWRDLRLHPIGVHCSWQDAEPLLPSGGMICVPVRKPKAKGDESEMIQQSFSVQLQPHRGEVPKRPLPPTLLPAKRGRQLPERETQRLAKGA